MDELTAIGKVCDRLTGGVMFHSDHADLMWFLGLEGFAKLHERGFTHDSESLRRMRRECMMRTGKIPQQGNQSKGNALAKVSAYSRRDLSANDRYRLTTESLKSWSEWEHGTAKVLGEAAEELGGSLWRMVDKLRRGAEDEAVEADNLMMEAMACDMAHVYEMQR